MKHEAALRHQGDDLSARQQLVLKAVQEQGFATIEALARQFGVSNQTVRRDIIQLEKAHLLQRFHGGAGLRDNSVRLGYAQKQVIAINGKERIGRAVAHRIPDGASVFLDVGTTVEAVARALLVKNGLQVFTCSAAVAMLFTDHPRIEVFVTGGALRGPNGSLVGSVTIDQIGLFKVDFTIMSFAGFDTDGAPMDFDLQKIAVRQASLAHSRSAIAVADSSKFDRTAVGRLAPLSSFDILVTDAEPPEALRRCLIEAGTKCIVATD
ncbi:DeoR/GlpR family DNA-binding transcription regulator [Microvirga alba]|uniref:DeoR/GlpR transcriptional regulator n=1 Tax=Microvirga alba TaxID=2791025 RepID=A0A931FLX4_9HYPH|nr:DeoR/GlpR family DNA-binding transcription regulator [Microvirga alba]MBF9231905.1 DeoR/GlpR transcriptional regulator [Microvirga alba]